MITEMGMDGGQRGAVPYTWEASFEQSWDLGLDSADISAELTENALQKQEKEWQRYKSKHSSVFPGVRKGLIR
jgi:hypothetical protein